MEALSTGLQSSEIKVRTAALDGVLARLRHAAAGGTPRAFGGYEAKADQLLRFMSNCVSILKDANPKLVMTGLDCVQLLMDQFAEAFVPLVNMTFELLFSKYCASDLRIRSRATEVMVGLVNMQGLAASFDKLAQHLNHKNFRVKEHILFTILLLLQTYGDDVAAIPNLAIKVAGLLADPTNSVRQLAVDTLATLHTVLGDQLLLDLEAAGTRTMQLRLIQEAVRGGTHTLALNAMGSLGSATLSGGLVNNHSPISTHKEAFGLAPEEAGPAARSGKSKAAVTVPSARERAASSTAQRTLGAAPSSSSTSSSSSSTTMTPFDGGAAMSLYHPASFIGLIQEGALAKPASLYSEKDLQKAFAAVSQGLAKVDDWQARTAALGALQGIAQGDGMEFEGALVSLLRGCHEVITAQIADLRSSVSKEACRTVAVLARAMGPAFAPFAEMWVPALMKQVVLKIQVMASAADRSIRIILSTTTAGFPKLLPLLLDQCLSKTPALRKSALEYLCLSCAVWRSDALEGRLGPIRQMLRSAVSDADAGARKTARHLFWVLRGRPAWQAGMDMYLAELDPTSQKHIHAEYHNPAPELLEVLDLLARPVTSTEVTPVSAAARQEAGQKPEAGEARESAASRARANSVSRLEAAAATAATAASATRQSRDTGRDAGLLSRAAAAAQQAVQQQQQHDEDEPPRRPHTTGLAGMGSMRRLSTVPMQPMRVSAEREPATRTVIVSTERTVVSAPSSSSSSSSPTRPGPSLAGTDLDAAPFSVHHQHQAPTQPQPQPLLQSQAGRVPVPVLSAGGLKGMTGATRVQRPAPRPPAEEAAPPPVRPAAHERTEGPAETPVIFSADFLRTMAEDSHWGTRLRCFEAIHQRLQRGAAAGGAGETSASVELFLDLAAAHLGDAHQKVAAEVLAVVGACIESFAGLGASRLGTVLVALFHRLADRRQQVRDQSNLLLNAVRVAYDPVLVVGALSPKIPEIPERMKTAVMQFLGVVVPHCGAYFANAQNTWAFLGRMAAVLGGTGTKPSVTLVVAGRRLLELVYSASAAVVLGQIAAMPLQQQTCLKRMLDNAVPDIDALVAAAGRADWRGTKAAPGPGSAARSVAEDEEKEVAETKAEAAAVATPAVSVSVAAASPSPRVHIEPVSPRSPALPCELLPARSPLDTTLLPMPAHMPTPPSATAQTQQVLSHAATTAAASASPLPPPTRTLVWLLHALRPSAGCADKLEALREVKRLVRAADDAYWAKNCSQILSVLLEAFGASGQDAAAATPSRFGLDKDAAAMASAPLTGYTPLLRDLMADEAPGSENRMPNSNGRRVSNVQEGPMPAAESMHLACKILLLLTKHRSEHVKNFTELLASRLCQAAAFAPVAVALHSEQILSDLAPFDPARMVRLVLPYAGVEGGASPHVRLLALHVLAAAIRHLSSAQLLRDLPSLVEAALPSLSSSLVDLRKAVVFVLVEAYVVIGDALYPFVQDLTPPQRKLFTIYIDRKMAQT